MVHDSAGRCGREADPVGSSGRASSSARSAPTLRAMNSHGNSQAASGSSQSSKGMSYPHCGRFLFLPARRSFGFAGRSAGVLRPVLCRTDRSLRESLELPLPGAEIHRSAPRREIGRLVRRSSARFPLRLGIQSPDDSLSGPNGLRGHRRSPTARCPKRLRRPGQLTRDGQLRPSNRNVSIGFRPDMSEGAWQQHSSVRGWAVSQSAIAKKVPCSGQAGWPKA